MPLLGLVLYLLIFILAVIFSFRDPLISFGLFLYLFSIGFFSNFFAYVPGMMGDRYLLVPSLGWCIVLAGILYKFSNQKDGSNTIQWSTIGAPAKYIFAVVLVFYSVLTFSRNMDWKDDLTLFRKDIRYVNESSQAHNLLALHLMQHSEIETLPDKKTELAQEALGHFKKAKEIYPAFFNVTFDIGRVYLKLNMPDSALMSLKDALTLDTVYPEVYRMIGDIYNYKQMYGAAEPYYEKLIRLEPANYEGYSKLSYDYFMQKNYDSSISVNKKALISMPNQLQPIINIARVFIAINKPDSASVYLNTALKLQPNNGEVLGLLKQINK
jgi:tetratricopeptide (TPR) repeat protein